MEPHTPAALGFMTGLEAMCGVSAHAQPGAPTPASAAAVYNTTGRRQRSKRVEW